MWKLYALFISLSLPLFSMHDSAVPRGMVIIDHYELALFLKDNYRYDFCDKWYDALEDNTLEQTRAQLKSIFSSLAQTHKSSWHRAKPLSDLLKDIGLRSHATYKPARVNIIKYAHLCEEQKYHVIVDASIDQIINGIGDVMLSYSNKYYLSMRKDLGDDYIESEPYMPLILHYYDDRSIQINGIPGACQHEFFQETIDYYRLFNMEPSFMTRALLGLLQLSTIFIPQTYAQFPCWNDGSLEAYERHEQQRENAFKIIDLPTNASDTTITKKCHKLFLHYHPDKSDEVDAQEKYYQIYETCKLLRNK